MHYVWPNLSEFGIDPTATNAGYIPVGPDHNYKTPLDAWEYMRNQSGPLMPTVMVIEGMLDLSEEPYQHLRFANQDQETAWKGQTLIILGADVQDEDEPDAAFTEWSGFDLGIHSWEDAIRRQEDTNSNAHRFAFSLPGVRILLVNIWMQNYGVLWSTHGRLTVSDCWLQDAHYDGIFCPGSGDGANSVKRTVFHRMHGWIQTKEGTGRTPPYPKETHAIYLEGGKAPQAPSTIEDVMVLGATGSMVHMKNIVDDYPFEGHTIRNIGGLSKDGINLNYNVHHSRVEHAVIVYPHNAREQLQKLQNMEPGVDMRALIWRDTSNSIVKDSVVAIDKKGVVLCLLKHTAELAPIDNLQVSLHLQVKEKDIKGDFVGGPNDSSYGMEAPHRLNGSEAEVLKMEGMEVFESGSAPMGGAFADALFDIHPAITSLWGFGILPPVKYQKYANAPVPPDEGPSKQLDRIEAKVDEALAILNRVFK